jgi:hypothetical protein
VRPQNLRVHLKLFKINSTYGAAQWRWWDRYKRGRLIQTCSCSDWVSGSYLSFCYGKQKESLLQASGLGTTFVYDGRTGQEGRVYGSKVGTVGLLCSLLGTLSPNLKRLSTVRLLTSQELRAL